MTMIHHVKTLLAACGVVLITTMCMSAQSDKDSQSFSSASPYDTDFTQAAESTINGVVSIKSYATPRQRQYYNQGGSDFFSDPLLEFFFGQPGQNRRRQAPRQQQPDADSEESQQQLGLGSGVIIDATGYIVTNNHVINGADRLEVTLNDNRSFNATVIGADPDTDLALIKIDAKDLPVIPFGDSDKLKVGEWVLAVGNPFGFTSTVTAGIVSAKARSISAATHASRTMGIESYIQTDAAVNPGNSGGALVNLQGELVGINTAIYSQTGNYAGYSFAIPTSIVSKIAADLRQFGTVQRAVLGIRFAELTPKIIKEKNITAVTEGLLVGEVIDRSSAKEAGIMTDDVITAIDDQPTKNTAQLLEHISRHRPGDTVTITFYRNNKKQTATVTLRNNQGNTALTPAATVNDLGCELTAIDEDTRRQLNISGGVRVSNLTDGLFKSAGIKDGFIISDINRTRVSSAEDVEKIYKSIMKDDDYDKVMYIGGFYPTGRRAHYAVTLAE